jgi:competence protein ComEA
MQDGFSFESVTSFLRSNFLLVGSAVVGLILLGYGYFMMQPAQEKEAVVFEAADQRDSGSQSNATSQAKNKEIIFVDIAGAVEKPGVYEVPAAARVQDVLTKAGGLAKKADKQGIAKTVNLAAKVSDGMKLYFPFVGEASIVGVQSSGISGGSGQSGGLINVNSASSLELESLNGVGEVTAGKIISGRPYANIEELKTKKVVGNALFEKIKEQVSVN